MPQRTENRSAFRSSRICAIEPLESRSLFSSTFYVSLHGRDSNSGADPAHAWRHIQKAFNFAVPGSTVIVEAGRYNEKDILNVSGSSDGGYITFQAQGRVVIDGSGRAGANIVDLSNHDYIKFIGFQLVNDLHVNDGSGIRIEGTGSNIVIQNNTIHQITGLSGMGITVYGESATTAISNLIITGNTIYNCQSAPSEALTLSGNIDGFAVTHNSVHDINNIGIDFSGAYGFCPDPAVDLARNGICEYNVVARCHNTAGYCDGIYVDGGQNITVAYNSVTQSDLGIEVGCENAGHVSSDVVVRDNNVYLNYQGGIVFGGYSASVGRVVDCQFLNNTLYHNDTKSAGNGEIWIQYASDCLVENNLVVSTKQNLFVDGVASGANNTVDYNLYFTPSGPAAATFFRDGTEFDGFSAEQAAAIWDQHSVFADPLLVNPKKLNFRLLSTSPAINAGDPNFAPATGETDIFGNPRVMNGRVDIGAQEAG